MNLICNKMYADLASLNLGVTSFRQLQNASKNGMLHITFVAFFVNSCSLRIFIFSEWTLKKRRSCIKLDAIFHQLIANHLCKWNDT